MPCAPGTAFNPRLGVCDWPYKVPGCGHVSTTTTHKPWWPTHKPTHPPPSTPADTDRELLIVKMCIKGIINIF